MIPMLKKPISGNDDGAWICECHRVLHGAKEAMRHQHEHALKRLDDLR